MSLSQIVLSVSRFKRLICLAHSKKSIELAVKGNLLCIVFGPHLAYLMSQLSDVV